MSESSFFSFIVIINYLVIFFNYTLYPGGIRFQDP
jgi:hypothetical protein